MSGDQYESPGRAFSGQVASERRLGRELTTATANMLRQVQALARHNEVTPAMAHVIWTNEVQAALQRMGVDPQSDEGRYLLEEIDDGLGDDAYEMAIEAKRTSLGQADYEDALGMALNLDSPSMLASFDDMRVAGASWLSRVKSTVRTASTGLQGLVTQKVLTARGIPTKQWITRRDDKVRDSHAAADGQVVPLDQPFRVGGALLMYPGDRNAPIGETANCRCVAVGRR